MGIRSWIDAKAKIVHLEYRGEVAIDEFRTVIEAVFGDPAYRPGFGFLVDRRHTPPAQEGYVASAVEVAFQNQPMLTGARWAVVVSNPASVKAARMGIEFAHRALVPQVVHVFEELEREEDWLRLTADVG